MKKLPPISLILRHKQSAKISRKWLLAILQNAVSEIPYHLDHSSELNVLLTNNKNIRFFNQNFRSIDRSTDVLSFSLLEGSFSEFRGELLGDIIISTEMITVQAKQHRRSFEYEFAHIFIHGILHIFGYDHQNARETKTMKGLERKILTRCKDIIREYPKLK